MQWHLSDYSEGFQEYCYIQAILPWVPRLRAIGLLHKEAYPPWFDFQKRYFSGTTVWTTNATSSKTSKTVDLVRRTIGSTAMRSLFRTQARVRHFLSFLWISRLPESRRVSTRLFLAPSRSMNQLVQLHLRLFPRWTSSGKASTRDSSAGQVSLFTLEFSANKAFLLHSSQSVTTAITRNLLHFKPSARQVLQALKEGMCEVRPLTMEFAHTDFIAKQSLQLLRHGDLLDISFRPRDEIRCFFSSRREETHIFHCWDQRAMMYLNWYLRYQTIDVSLIFLSRSMWPHIMSEFFFLFL